MYVCMYVLIRYTDNAFTCINANANNTNTSNDFINRKLTNGCDF